MLSSELEKRYHDLEHELETLRKRLAARERVIAHQSELLASKNRQLNNTAASTRTVAGACFLAGITVATIVWVTLSGVLR